MSNLKFKNNRTRARNIAEIIHTDVNGPIRQTGFNGEKYFVSFIDDFSRIAVVYCIKSKDEVFDCFEKYVNRIQNQTGNRIKEIRCDRGTEYLNRKFYTFAKNKGIWLRPSPAHTHELNGVAERFNRTVMDRARCLLTEANLEKRFWPECIKAAAYIGNRLIASNQLNATPYELFFGKKPNVSHFKIYGSIAFVRIPEVNRFSKLSPKSVKGFLVGYDDMGYRILVDEKVIVSRHVEFIEKDEQFIKITDNAFEDLNEEQNSIDEEENEDVEEKKEETEEIPSTRSKRDSKKPKWHDDYVIDANFSDIVIPNTYDEAIKSNEKIHWQEAMDREFKSLMKNKTWSLIDIEKVPNNTKIIQVKWVYRIKADGQYKARLVALGYQQPNLLNEEIYSPVAKMPTLKTLLSVVCNRGLFIEQMDVQTAFLNGNINTETYVYQPEGFILEQNKVCLLKKALYGLRESPRAWYECFHNYIISLGFDRSKHDNCLYTKTNKMAQVYILLYVDDLLICSSNYDELVKVKQKLSHRFEMTDLGKIKNFLGIEVEYIQDTKVMSLNQKTYIKSLTEKYQITESKSYKTPMEMNLKLELSESYDSNIKYRNLIGALLYISQGTRPDISYAVNYLSGFQNGYSKTHFKYALRILKYLYSTRNLVLKFDSSNSMSLIDCFVDADWAGDVTDRKSRSGILIHVLGNPVLWISRKQKVVTRSSCHAEFIALAEAVEELFFLKGIAEDLSITFINPIKIYEDNSGAKDLAMNGNFIKNSKHIDVSYHYVNDYVKKNVIEVCKVSSENQLADRLTKSLGSVRFEKLI